MDGWTLLSHVSTSLFPNFLIPWAASRFFQFHHCLFYYPPAIFGFWGRIMAIPSCSPAFMCSFLVHRLWTQQRLTATLKFRERSELSETSQMLFYWRKNKSGQSIPDVYAGRNIKAVMRRRRRCWSEMTAEDRHVSALDDRNQAGLGYLSALFHCDVPTSSSIGICPQR